MMSLNPSVSLNSQIQKFYSVHFLSEALVNIQSPEQSQSRVLELLGSGCSEEWLVPNGRGL